MDKSSFKQQHFFRAGHHDPIGGNIDAIALASSLGATSPPEKRSIGGSFADCVANAGAVGCEGSDEICVSV